MTEQDVLNMTIDELIDTIDLKVKLGADKGSAFVFCGMLSDIDIDELDEIIKERYRASIEKSKGTIETMKNKPKGFKDFERETLRKKHAKMNKLKDKDGDIQPELMEKIDKEFPINKKTYNLWLAHISRCINTARTTLENSKRKLAKYTTIRSRQIREIYKSISEEDTYILLYDGNETGFAWTTEEFEKGGVYDD